uniref:Uncharacterized protein n=1 Tax=Panagrolaimus davidi TaxID=227884 RepID=A0A914PCY4_9BILA
MSLPSLNNDILTDIIKQLLKNGNQDSVIQFGLSGKEPLKALIKVFALIKHVVLYDDYYTFGLDGNKCCELYIYDKNEPYFRSLMLFIGDSVTNLHMDFSKESSVEFYHPFLGKISEIKTLVKELHFNIDVGDVNDLFQGVSFAEYMTAFSSLEHIKFNVTTNIILSFTHRYYSHITDDIYNLENAVKYSVNAPSKVTYFIQYPVIYHNTDFSDTPFMTDSLFKEYEYDDNVHNVYCLRQTLESAGMKPVDLEIHVAKST